MPVDASIYSQVGRQNVQPLNPLDAMANAYQLQNAQIDSQNKQQAMRDDQMSRQAAMQAGGDSSKLYQLLMQGGNIGAAQKVQKQMLDVDKSKADIAHTGATTQKTLSEAEALKIGQHADILSQVQTPEQAMQWAKMGLDAGVLKPQQYEMALANINKLQDPQSFEAWKQQAALGARKYIELNKPTFQNQNLGGSMRTLSLPGLGGAPQVVSSAPITQSADSIASNARIASEGALNRGVTLAGQDKTDARARELNKITADNKPLTEGQSKSALFGTRMAMANKIFDTLENSGTTTSTPGMNSGYGIGNVVSALSSADQQQLMQAKRDFLNAVLRRESGAVIGESEFSGGEKQYFPQVGDDKKTIAQKKANREAAMRGVLIDVPEGRRAEVVREISGTGKPIAGGFKYLGTE